MRIWVREGWTDASNMQEVLSRYSGEPIDEVSKADLKDVERFISTAEKGAGDMAALIAWERASILNKAADLAVWPNSKVVVNRRSGDLLAASKHILSTCGGHMQTKQRVGAIVLVALISLGTRGAKAQNQLDHEPTRNISRLNQHFTDLKNISPWIFVPTENIKAIDTTEHPGLLTIWEAGKGKDIKGILKDPIEIGDYSLPWEFQLQFAQNERVFKAATLSDKDRQLNYAIGVNLAVTFSDPSIWPKDRTQMPPETHSLQLFVVHLGNYGEMYRTGLPQIRNSPLNYYDPSPETYLVYGRGDLAPALAGNWQIPFIWTGYQPPKPGQLGSAANWSWSADQGPASFYVRFRVRMISDTQLEVGFGYGLGVGWRMRPIDVSKFGKITGIWQIGPIVSLDHWIPDKLAPELGIHPPPVVQLPDSSYEYFVDYATFYGNGPRNLQDLSVDYDVPGYEGTGQKWFQEGNAITETLSHPGYLTVTLMGMNGMWGMAPMLSADMPGGLGYVDLTEFKPPWEVEASFIAPGKITPWNLFLFFTLFDKKGVGHLWTPGLENFPGLGVKYINYFIDPKTQGAGFSNEADLKKEFNIIERQHDIDLKKVFKIETQHNINVHFEKDLPQSIVAHKPVYILVQLLDEHRVRVGFKAKRVDPWTFSKPFDTTKLFGPIAKIQLPEFASKQGDHGEMGWGAGNYPYFQQFLIRYVHIRYGSSTSTSSAEKR
jgi:hypothetical protein